jgi:phage tail protein X
MAAEAITQAILRAVYQARGIPGLPAYGEIFP